MVHHLYYRLCPVEPTGSARERWTVCPQLPKWPACPPGATRPDTVAHTLISPLGPGGHVPSAGLQPQRVRPEVSFFGQATGSKSITHPSPRGPCWGLAHVGLLSHLLEAKPLVTGLVGLHPLQRSGRVPPCLTSFSFGGLEVFLGLWLPPSSISVFP